jgi:hypothetical protein
MLAPGDLADLGYWLQEQQFAVAPDQLIAAARLVNGSRRFQDAGVLGAYLAPIFCSDAQQQARFAQVYEQWLARRGLVMPAPLLAHGEKSAVLAGEVAKPSESKVGNWRKRLRASWPGIVLLVVLMVFAGVWRLQNREGTEDGAGKTPGALASASAPGLATPTPKPTPAPTLAPPSTPAPAPTYTRTYHANPFSIALLSLLLLSSAAWWLYATFKRRAFLQRLPASSNQTTQGLRSSSGRTAGLLVNDVRQLGGALRRRATIVSRNLDVDATITATIRAGGQIKPVFGSRIEPEYLILVDRASHRDHQAQLANELVATLLAQGVLVERYEFDRDPRRAQHVPHHGPVLHHGPQSLISLANRHAGGRLLIFSDGRGFIDPYTGRAMAWLAAFRAWAQPVMLTPQAHELWGAREHLLAQSGLLLLPLSGDGLRIFGQVFDRDCPLPQVAVSERTRLRPAYLQDVDVLHDRVAPPLDVSVAVMAALERDLQADGMAWLSGCAVYPELYWGITLTIGDSLICEPRRRAQVLAQLVRLPWLRVGFMPDWLREALLARLTGEAEVKVRHALAQFFAAVTLVRRRVQISSGDDVLQIATTMPTGGCWARVRGWFGGQIVPQAAEDKVFLCFMSGHDGRLPLGAKARLKQLLYQQGTPLAGPKWFPVCLMILLMSSVIFALS